MGTYRIGSARPHSKGFTLIASLLMLLLLSGIAIGVMMMVNTEGKVGSTDLQNDRAFHAAEGGIEKMAADLNSTFQNAQAPTAAQICAVSGPSHQPAIVGVIWTQYSVMPGSSQSPTCPTSLTANWGQITSGQNGGLWAQIIPVNMLVTANLVGGQEVSMTRQAQVALIPVFQFGVFSESDLSFFSGPSFDMVGPVHTNGDLYPFVGPGSTLTFHNQLSAYGNVIRTQLANGYSASVNYNGTVDIPTVPSGCSTPTTTCTPMATPVTSSPYGDGSLQGAGGDPATSAYNTSNWNAFSKNTTNLMLVNGNYGSVTVPGTGAKKLSMPFVNGTNFPYEIIRRPPAGESSASALGQSREYNMAQIHVLLSDDPSELPGGASDTNNVRLANVTPGMVAANSNWTLSNPYGIVMTSGNYPSSLGTLSSGTYNQYFAAASNAFPDTTNCSGTHCPAGNAEAAALASDWPYYPQPWTSAMASAAGSPYPLLVPTGAPLSPLGNTTNGPLTTLYPCPPNTVASVNLPPGCPTAAAPVYPYYTLATSATSGTAITSNATAMAAGTTSWNLIDGWLRVEYADSSGTWHPVTNEWLKLGFARGTTPPTQSGGGTPATSADFTPTPNPINPNAILLLQEPADRNGDGVADQNGLPPACTSTTGCTSWNNALPPEVQVDTASGSPYFGVTTSSTTTQSISRYNWYPINFYDAREGEVRDVSAGADSCSTNGVMNAVEIDVGNLKRWLSGAIGTSGTNVNYVAQNGYVLYFSDRRGMLPNPNGAPPHVPGTKSGDSGLEDVINASVAAGTPNGLLEPTPSGKTISPEDVNQNSELDNWGAYNLGLGFYGTVSSPTMNLNTQIMSTGSTDPDPFGTATGTRINSCSTTARKNWVSGARHVLRLVDASLGNLPLTPTGTLSDPGGLTVASENPVYIMGDYNSNSTDPAWNTTPSDVAGHASAAVIADAVTLLSNNWLDSLSLQNSVTNPGNRPATTTYYRMAIAGGKNINFPLPTWTGVYQDFGTDGGVHNFLRYLEDWSNATLYYKGSIVSLYYATYNTGIYKCCNDVYSPPTRNYSFDSDFTLPQGLPPGTPMFRDVETLTYRQLFATRQAGQ